VWLLVVGGAAAAVAVSVVVIMALIMMTMMTTTTIIMYTYEDRMELICTDVKDTKGPVLIKHQPNKGIGLINPTVLQIVIFSKTNS
jgi:hypothetical protein